MAAVEIAPLLFREQDVSDMYHASRPRYNDDRLAERIMAFLSVNFKAPFENAADIGCGTGLSTKILAPHFKHVTGLDPSPTQISTATASNSDKNLVFCVGKAEDLSMIPDGSLQLITAGTAIHYFDCKIFFKEVDRVLKPGGCFAQFGYNSYYSEPRNLAFDDPANPIPPEVAKRCNDLIVEIFQTILSEEGYEDALNRENEGFEPPYAGPERHTFELTHPCTVDIVLNYIKSLGLWQNYCQKVNKNPGEVMGAFKERLLAILKEVTNTPEKVSMKMRTRTYLILARKPL